MAKVEKSGFPAVPMEASDFLKLKRYVDHAMSVNGGLKGDGAYSFTDVESAIGALIIGQAFGYRVLELVHSGPTRKKYARLLGIDSFRDVCPATGVYTSRHHLYRAMGAVSDWWRGRHELPRKDKAKRTLVGGGG